MRFIIAITFKYLIEVFCPVIDILYYAIECFEEFLYIVIFLFLSGAVHTRDESLQNGLGIV